MINVSYDVVWVDYNELDLDNIEEEMDGPFGTIEAAELWIIRFYERYPEDLDVVNGLRIRKVTHEWVQ